ncbi:adenosylcobinamide-phosphate synthase CbiB [Novosphingobium mangrovi (ex Hu et al. 2023)]|uniref:Cobalamin biosynthesis protein CobD n=1 Tax=Novosphingobium mangrovi (ex Hu et al. 2023) TaxID=2930094 RepID=A0ABT0ABW6_9SPHN|nr:adenosylcobinamide-phosphate synthase CbiB [Novosphingobium mangrovi (ex Hu et al. 2023)]MCJ1960682.1 adenosylcobinamide-phosphate synthase CbiB [Novosphingobium mangrovi (ex Hu et al. 2023)]
MVEGLAVLGALVLDAALGWPDGLYRRIGHPVGAFARLIGGLERRWNRPNFSFSARRLRGVAAMIVLPVMVGGAAWGVETVAGRLAGSWSWFVVALAAWPALAQRSLYEHVVPVRRALAASDLPAARMAVGRIVGRDTRDLDAPGVARAGIESLAESFCDGVIAPLFWFVLAGLPGLWVYKAINTADSLIGHPEEPLRAYGWAAARIDDLANFLPARLSGVLICLAGGGGWRILWRDHAHHASPNAGWSEAAMAGALGLRLAGPLHYDGIRTEKPWIGDEGGIANAPAMRRAETIYLRACLLAWLVCALATGGRAWLG